VRKDALGQEVSKVSKVPKVIQEIVGPRVLVVVVRQAHRDRREFKVLRENVENLALVLVVQQDPWARRVNAEKWANKVQRVIQAPLDLKALVVEMGSKAIRELQGQWVAQACEVQRVIVEFKARKETLACRVLKETREMLAFVDHLVQEACQDHQELREHLVSEVLLVLWVAVVLRARKDLQGKWVLVVQKEM